MNRRLLYFLLPALLATAAAAPTDPASPDDTRAQTAEEPGYLGIQIRSVEAGARVIEVFPGSGAEAAGLTEGDVIFQADGHPLAGLPVKAIVAHLKGERGTQAAVLVERFPNARAIEELRITRGPPTASMQKTKHQTWLDPVEREANLMASSLGADRLPNLASAIKTWSEGVDPDAVDGAILRAMRQADALGWAQGSKMGAVTRRAFWLQVGSDDALAALLRGREPATRLALASLLARHQGSAVLAHALLQGLPNGVDPARQKALKALAKAVEEGTPAGVAALSLPANDAWTMAGWHASFGPWISDLAALELAWDLAPAPVPTKAAPAPPTAPDLPEVVLERLERSGLYLPWQQGREYANLGYLAAPQAPTFKIERQGGGYLSLEEHKGPLVLSFWASWCGPCRQELPALQDLAKAQSASGLQVWAINTDTDREKVAPTLEALGLDLPVGFATRDMQADYGVTSLPRMFVLDADHRMVLDHTGYSEDNFPELAAEIKDIAAGSGGGERSLAEVAWGGPRVRVSAARLMEDKPLVLTTDSHSTLWLGFEDALVPVSMQDRTLLFHPERAVPLPFPATIAEWSDLDGDGQQELLSAKAGSFSLLASSADGMPRWTQRDPDPLAAIAVLQRPTGPIIVVLRIGGEEVPHRLGPLPDGSAREPIWEPRPRLDILNTTGDKQATVSLPAQVVHLAPHTVTGELAMLLDNGKVYALNTDLQLQEVPHGVDTVRQLAWLEGPDGPQLAFTSNAARSLYWGRLGIDGQPAAMAMTGGGDLVGLDANGAPSCRLLLQRPPEALLADVDGDGRDEFMLYAHWFGLAALHLEL